MSVRGFNTGSGVEQYDYEYLDNKPEIPTKKSDIGLGNVDNTSDFDKPVSNATQTALNEKVPNSRKVNGKALSADITLTSGDIGYDASTAYDTGTVGKELTDLNRQISESITPAIEEIETALDDKAPVIINTASGEIASFADGADGMPVKSLVANIEPVQDLHGYDYPWPAGGGINKMPAAPQSSGTVNGLTYTSDGNGKYTISGTSAAGDTITFYLEKNATLISGGKLSLFNNISGSINLFFNLDGTDQTYWGLALINRTATIAQADAKEFNRIKIIFYSAGSVNLSLSPMIYEGDTQTTFSPYSNICPISGHTGASVQRTGKNLLPSMSTDETTYGVTWHVNEDNSISVSGTATGNSIVDFGRGHLTLKPGTYTTNRAKDGVVCAIWENSSPAQLIDGAGGTFVLTQDTPIFIRFYVPSGTTVNTTIYPQLELGSTATDYEPYQGNQISVNWETEAGTVYGGTLDVTNGVLTVDKACVTIDGANIQAQNNGHTDITTRAIFMANSPAKAYGDNFISDKFHLTTANDIVWKASGIPASTGVEFYLPRDVPDTFAGVNAWFADNPTQLCYPLATPVTYQLTKNELDTLLGTNNIWTDVGTVDVEYPADTKLYIEQLTKPTEDDMTANANIAANKFFMIGNTLYFSTAAIAQGATIIPGTNCNVISLADALNNLNS